ncbi:ROK family glucokinase [Virgibacillus kimchii]
MPERIIGVDIGGTTIKIGLIDDRGNIIKKWEITTNKTKNSTLIVQEIWESIYQELRRQQIKENEITGIGVGSPGVIDEANGIVYNAFNVGWLKYDLVHQFKKLTTLPVYPANDANIASLGENWKGAGKQVENMLMITLGTGVGGGIITNGQLLTGEAGMAGEIGHMTVDIDGYRCSCGRIGCVETIASAPGIVRQAKECISKEPKSKLAQIEKVRGTISARDVFNLARAGDSNALTIRRHTAESLGLLIANTAAVLNPAKVIIGGGISHAGADFLAEIQTAFKHFSFPGNFSSCELKLAQLGNDAGIIGAAFLVKQKTQNMLF